MSEVLEKNRIKRLRSQTDLATRSPGRGLNLGHGRLPSNWDQTVIVFLTKQYRTIGLRGPSPGTNSTRPQVLNIYHRIQKHVAIPSTKSFTAYRNTTEFEWTIRVPIEFDFR